MAPGPRELEVLLEQLDQMEAPERYRLEFAAKKALLQELDYLRGDEFTARGEFASRIQVQELLVTELFFAGIFHEYTIDEINGLVAGIDYEPRRGESRRPQRAVNLAQSRNWCATFRIWRRTSREAPASASTTIPSSWPTIGAEGSPSGSSLKGRASMRAIWSIVCGGGSMSCDK